MSFLSNPVRAQGLVSGTVIDGPTGKPVEGVTVVLAGTLFGAVTGPDGDFSLGPVATGTYTLKLVRAGYEPAEVRATVPGSRIVVELGKERPPLTGEPLFGVAAGFEIGSYEDRGDPLLGDSESGARRVAGVHTVRYGTAFSSPVIRGFGADRVAGLRGGSTSNALAIPTVGVIDLSAAPDFQGGRLFYGAAAWSTAPYPAGVWQSPHAAKTPTYSNASIETSYQTNLDAFRSRGYLRGSFSRTRYSAVASWEDGSGYKASSGRWVRAPYSRLGTVIGVRHDLSRRTGFEAAGRLVDVRSAEIPGAPLSIESGRFASGSLFIYTIPEKRVLRRISGQLSLSESDAVLINPDGSDETGRALKRHVDVVIAADLFHPSLERLRAGLRFSSEMLDGRVSLLGSALQPLYFWPGIDRRSGEVFFSLSSARLESRWAVGGRLGLLGLTSASAAAGTGEPLPDRSYTTAAISATSSYRFGPRLTFSFAYGLTRRPPSVEHLYAATLVPAIGPGIVAARSNLDLAPELIHTADLRLGASLRKATVRLRPFFSHTRNYIAPHPPSVGPAELTWVYRNGTANFWGFEISASHAPMPFVSLSGHVDYVRATDRRRGESPPGIPPLSGRVDLTAASPGESLLFEISSEFAFRASRVATSLGEPTGKGYLLLHWAIGLPLSDRLAIRVGTFNLLNTSYRPHPGLLDQDISGRVPGPGRSWLFSLRLSR